MTKKKPETRNQKLKSGTVPDQPPQPRQDVDPVFEAFEVSGSVETIFVHNPFPPPLVIKDQDRRRAAGCKRTIEILKREKIRSLKCFDQIADPLLRDLKFALARNLYKIRALVNNRPIRKYPRCITRALSIARSTFDRDQRFFFVITSSLVHEIGW